MVLNIQTLGNFDISLDGQSILKESARSYKLYRLLQYFITYRGRRLLPETIIDNLYEENESSDPKNVLRTQIHRLRNLIRGLLDEGADETKYFNISINNGFYSFELGENSILDIDEFKNNIALGEEKEVSNMAEALEYYQDALKLYKGSYLSANSYETWLVPVRNQYSILYIKTLHRAIEILESLDDNYSIIELCEEALAIEPYEETVHIYLIEAMLRIGQIKNAMSHYTFITSVLSKELGINPSTAFKNIYRKIQSYYDEKSETNIDNIKNKLEEKESKGALLCEFDYFKFLYNIEKRKGLREGNSGYISLISINNGIIGGDEEEQKDMVKTVSGLLGKTLRKGDVYSFWNDNQILLLLHGAKENDLTRIESRIRKGFNNKIIKGNYNIDINFKPLTMDEQMYKID